VTRVEVQLAPGRAPIPSGATAVVVDILRATTTLTIALAAGAARVLEAATIPEAFALRSRHPGALLGGERDGRRIEGFDLGNSPSEYVSGVVGGRTLIFASTNGSLAIRHARPAARRLLGAFVNAHAVARAVRARDHVVILCAGKLGSFAQEDAAFAGWLARELEAGGATLEGPAARLARTLAPTTPDEIRWRVEGSDHGRLLAAYGGAFERDVAACAQLDTIDRVFEV
jgi:2-phosphosulfolactate phosphatase